MCRMILAMGSFSSPNIFNACIQMSQGFTANHNGQIKIHANGWGALWKDPINNNLTTQRSTEALTFNSKINALNNDKVTFLAVHARHATVPSNQGIEYSHPIELTKNQRHWYMMHNGFMPTVALELGMPLSKFDSIEYLQFLLANNENNFDARQVTEALDRLQQGNSSGNIFLINDSKAYIYQWYPKSTQFESYFTLNVFESDNQFIVTSEIIPDIAPASQWRSMKRGEAIELSI